MGLYIAPAGVITGSFLMFPIFHHVFSFAAGAWRRTLNLITTHTLCLFSISSLSPVRMSVMGVDSRCGGGRQGIFISQSSMLERRHLSWSHLYLDLHHLLTVGRHSSGLSCVYPIHRLAHTEAASRIADFEGTYFHGCSSLRDRTGRPASYCISKMEKAAGTKR